MPRISVFVLLFILHVYILNIYNITWNLLHGEVDYNDKSYLFM